VVDRGVEGGARDRVMINGSLCETGLITAVLAGDIRSGACSLPPLFGGIAQNSLQCGVEIASHLGHAVIAVLAKEG
jgi:hypothetical protein